MQVCIATNNMESGDWVVVTFEGNTVYSGHSIRPRDLAEILQSCVGYETIHFLQLTDSEMEDWAERNAQ